MTCTCMDPEAEADHDDRLMTWLRDELSYASPSMQCTCTSIAVSSLYTMSHTEVNYIM